MAVSPAVGALFRLLGLALPTAFLNLNFTHGPFDLTHTFPVLLYDFHFFELEHLIFVCFCCDLVPLHGQLFLQLQHLLLQVVLLHLEFQLLVFRLLNFLLTARFERLHLISDSKFKSAPPSVFLS